MKKLLSLPPNLVEVFHEVTGLSRDEYFCTCDPVGHRLGSGGGTAWLLQEAYRSQESGVGSQESDDDDDDLFPMQKPQPKVQDFDFGDDFW